MIQEDKIGIGYGLMGLLQDDARFVTFNGKAWILERTEKPGLTGRLAI